MRSTFALFAALLSSASATLLLQIGTKADSSAVYSVVDTAANLTIVPRDLVDMRAIDGAARINSFSLNMDSRRHHRRYFDQDEDDYRYTANIEKLADTGSVVLMSYLETGKVMPLLTVIDVKPEAFTIYTLRNFTVQSADVNLWSNSRWSDGEDSTGYVNLAFESVQVQDGSREHVGEKFTFTRPANDLKVVSGRREHHRLSGGKRVKDFPAVDDVQDVLVDDDL